MSKPRGVMVSFLSRFDELKAKQKTVAIPQPGYHAPSTATTQNDDNHAESFGGTTLLQEENDQTREEDRKRMLENAELRKQ